jgi:hypothetical protein
MFHVVPVQSQLHRHVIFGNNSWQESTLQTHTYTHVYASVCNATSPHGDRGYRLLIAHASYEEAGTYDDTGRH